MDIVMYIIDHQTLLVLFHVERADEGKCSDQGNRCFQKRLIFLTALPCAIIASFQSSMVHSTCGETLFQDSVCILALCMILMRLSYAYTLLFLE